MLVRRALVILVLAGFAGCGSIAATGQPTTTSPDVTDTTAVVPTEVGSTSPTPTTTTSTTTSTTRTAGTPLPTIEAVVWRSTGQLQVIDMTTGSVVRQLAEIAVGYPAPGPVSVTLTPDRRLAIVEWNLGEPGCLTEVGAIATDGSGGAVEDWGPGAWQANVSPDGRYAAWYAASPFDCTSQRIVVRDLTTGAVHEIAAVPRDGFSAGAGPWWLADSATVIFRDRDGNAAGPDTSTGAVALDVSTATNVTDGRAINLGCVQAQLDLWAQQVAAGDAVVSVSGVGVGQPTHIDLCPLDGSPGTALLDTPDSYRFAAVDHDGHRLLLIGFDGTLATALINGTVTPLPVDQVQAAAW